MESRSAEQLNWNTSNNFPQPLLNEKIHKRNTKINTNKKLFTKYSN